MEIQLKDFIQSGKIVAFLNFSGSFCKLKNNSKIAYITSTPFCQNISVQKYLEKKVSSFSKEKFINACRMVLLNSDILSQNVSRLSFTEMKKLRFVEALLISSEVLVFVDFEQGFYDKSRSYYQKLFVKLTNYGKCILIFTKDVSFLFGFCSEFYLFSKDKYMKMNHFYDERIYQVLEKPEIISYVQYLKSKNITMEEYIETKEVLKAIYRSVNSGEHL